MMGEKEKRRKVDATAYMRYTLHLSQNHVVMSLADSDCDCALCVYSSKDAVLHVTILHRPAPVRHVLDALSKRYSTGRLGNQVCLTHHPLLYPYERSSLGEPSPFHPEKCWVCPPDSSNSFVGRMKILCVTVHLLPRVHLVIPNRHVRHCHGPFDGWRRRNLTPTLPKRFCRHDHVDASPTPSSTLRPTHCCHLQPQPCRACDCQHPHPVAVRRRDGVMFPSKWCILPQSLGSLVA